MTSKRLGKFAWTDSSEVTIIKAKAERLDADNISKKGGTGSGNYGHSGRPGKTGGSGPGGPGVGISIPAGHKSGLAQGQYTSVYSVPTNKKAAMNKAAVLGPGHQVIRANKAYHVVQTTPTTPTPKPVVQGGISVPSGHKSGVPPGTYQSVYSVPTNKQAAVKKAAALGPGHHAVRINGAYHVLNTNTPSGTQPQVTTPLPKPAPAPPKPQPAAAPPAPVTTHDYWNQASKADINLAKKTGLIGADPEAKKYIRNVVAKKAPANLGKVDPDNVTVLKTVDSQTKKKILRQHNKDWDKNIHGHYHNHVRGVYETIHPPKREAAYQKIANQKDTVRANMYHGTSIETSAYLAQGHYKVLPSANAKVGRMLGNGIYLGDKSSKVAQYFDGYTNNPTKRTRGVILMNEVSLGNSVDSRFIKTQKTAANSTSVPYRAGWSNSQAQAYSQSQNKSTYQLKPNGDIPTNVDSIHAMKGTSAPLHRPLMNQEWAVRDAQAVIPRYWLDSEQRKGSPP